MASVEMSGVNPWRSGRNEGTLEFLIDEYSTLMLTRILLVTVCMHIPYTGHQTAAEGQPHAFHADVEHGRQNHVQHQLATYSHPWEHHIFQGRPVPEHIL